MKCIPLSIPIPKKQLDVPNVLQAFLSLIPPQQPVLNSVFLMQKKLKIVLFITIKISLVHFVIQDFLMMFKTADAEQPMKLELHVQEQSKLVPNTFVSPVHLVTLLLTTNVLLEFQDALNSMLMDFVLHALLVTD